MLPHAPVPLLAGDPSAALIVAFAVFSVLASRLYRVQRSSLYRVAAAELGLAWHPGGFFSRERRVMSGTIDGFRVDCTVLTRQEGECLQVTVGSAGREEGCIPAALELTRQAAGLRLFEGEDVVVGDGAFDNAVRVGGGAYTALAVLSPEARRSFLWTLDNALQVRVGDGRVIVELQASDTAGHQVESVRTAVRLAGKLVPPGEGLEAALARRALGDPLPGVRLNAFDALTATAGKEGARDIGQVCRRLLGDSHPELRLRAAMRLGEEGYEHLARLVRTPAGPERAGGGRLWWEISLPGGGDAPDEWLLETAAVHERRRARALLHLVVRQPRELVLPLLKEALRARGPLLVAALRSLETIADASCESGALAALDSRLQEVRDAAIGALGAIGTAASIPALHALTGAGAGSRSFRRAVDAAIARIQSRIPGAAAGQVVLVGSGEAAGRVSLAPEREAGNVALVSGAPEQG